MRSKIFLIIIILNGFVSSILSQTLFRSGLFLHYSAGGAIWNSSTPDVPQLINEYNVEHHYTGNQIVTLNIGESHFPPQRQSEDNNFWDTWHAVFTGESIYPEDFDSLQSYITNNPIIVIKSGWGAGPSQMGNPADTLIIEDYETGRTYYRTQWHWRSIVRVMESYPENFFVIWTGIPSNPGPSYDGTLAHYFVTWAKDTLVAGNDPVFGDFPDNVYVFDTFHLLATPTEEFEWGTAYWGMNPLYHDENDNHPNEAGCDVVAPLFVEETFNAAIFYELNYNLPVELSVFSASVIGSSIKLNWRTETEVNNYGFEVERKTNNWKKIGFVPGNGNSNSPKNYSFIDKDLMGGNKFIYRLKQIDTDGNFEYSNEIEAEIIPYNFELYQNYPNPFNPSTIIRFSLPQSVQIKINIYNMLGEQIATLADRMYDKGNHKVIFNTSSLPSGTYLYTLESSEFIQVKKMVLLK